MELQEGKCTAESVDNSKPTGFFIVVIVVLSVACVGLIGLSIYWHFSRRDDEGLYSQIS